MTLLEKPLGDLRRELIDIRQRKFNYDTDLNKLGFIITISRDSLRETEVYQQKLLQQLQQFEISLADVNEMLRANFQEKTRIEQQLNDDNDMEIRAKLMSLNAEALECRAVAVQLQQDAKIALAKAAEMEKRASDELIQQALEMKLKQQEIERNRAEELERRVRLEEERQRLKELEMQQKEQERLLALSRNVQQQQDDYADWPVHDFMNDDQCPPCLIRTAPNAPIEQIDVSFPSVMQTEHLLDNQEELISTPLRVNFDAKNNNNKQFVLLAIPYIVRRLPHRENVIKIRQSNGIWISLPTNETNFDSHKDKRFVECQLTESTCCAVVSRLKRERIVVTQQRSGRFVSTADSRVTLQWPSRSCEKDVKLNLRIQPVDLPTFTQFSSSHSHECQGLFAVGPIINLDFDEINLLKPIQLTLPMLIQGKKNDSLIKSTTNTPTTPNTQLTPQELILQQQQFIFKSMLGEDSTTERLALFYSNSNENTWQIDDGNVRLIDSKTHDLITMQAKNLHSRMILIRYDKQTTSPKQLSSLIPLLEQSLSKRTVSLILRHNRTNPSEVCFVCCSNHRLEQTEMNLDEENFTRTNEQIKELVLHEGQLLELRFRGNVLPTENADKTYSFAFNTHFPFYFQTTISEIDKYAQHFAAFFYGFIQIYSKQKVLRTIAKEIDKKKQQTEVKHEWHETDVCLAELVLRVDKSPEETRASTPKTAPAFVSEGILTPTLLHDIAMSLNGDEWRRLARRLGLTRMRIEAIERDFTEETAFHMLVTWFKRVSRSADKVSLLIHGLTNINRLDLVNELQRLKEERRQELKHSAKDDQSRLFQIAFNRICQRDECVRMWKQLARELLLKNQDIERIERDYPSKHERCLRSLEQWLDNDNRAEITVLARVIRALGFKALAREIDGLA